MILLITLWFNGFNMTIDSVQMYGIDTMKSCEKHLEFIIKNMDAQRGVCLMGDILQESHES